MPELRSYRRSCVVCGAGFQTRCTNAKYCDQHRADMYRKIGLLRMHERYVKKPKREYTEYTCIRCGRKIRAYGRCTNRKICDDCLMSTNSKDDLELLMQRKEVREEVIE